MNNDNNKQYKESSIMKNQVKYHQRKLKKVSKTDLRELVIYELK